MADEKEDKKSVDSKLVMSIAAVALTGLVVAWINSTQSTSTSVNQLEPQIEALQRAVEANSEWISEWPQTGELSADVRQNSSLLFLGEELERSFSEIDELEERIRSLEIENG